MSANERQAGGDHYKRMDVAPWDVIDTWPINERIAYYRASALKYLMRLNDKDTPLLNAQKAGHYVEKLAEVLAIDDSGKMVDSLKNLIANPAMQIEPKPGDTFTVDIDGTHYKGVFPTITCPVDDITCTIGCTGWCVLGMGERTK